ncbi:hypothetical protein [Hyalangium sp.]|uniref:hypothetical protein n=1 Tax=Hyalangium sp. TaxID=2028555 RepID=UPI002D3AC2E1|nr:hypothetical protein [Hyalangium sp.]HYH95874.1 hypothetical protein [Hyalangium sp.]
MTITLASGVGIDVQPLDAVVRAAASIEAEALIIPADALRDTGVLSSVAQKLTGSRCVVVAVLGPEAEHVHDELDELLVGDGTNVESLPTTTWHEDEEAEDVLRLVEQMVLSSGAGPRPGSILVTTASATAPTDLPELLRLLAVGLHTPKPAGG